MAVGDERLDRDGLIHEGASFAVGDQQVRVDFVALTGQYVLGNPLNQDTTLGPLVSAGAADAVRWDGSLVLQLAAP